MKKKQTKKKEKRKKSAQEKDALAPAHDDDNLLQDDDVPSGVDLNDAYFQDAYKDAGIETSAGTHLSREVQKNADQCQKEGIVNTS